MAISPAGARDSRSQIPWGLLALLLVGVRVAGTWYYQLITDCDQTFNYEEPTHYLLYGSGQQTWEYAPQYALRSYAYVGLHALIGMLVGAAWGADKIAVFHRIHVVLALACAAGEFYFVRGLARAFGRRVAVLSLFCLLASAGMLHAAPSYLPSTFTMCGLLFAWGAWLRGSVHSTVAATVIALVLGWPFAVVAVVPMGLHLLARPGLLRLLPAAILPLAAVCGLCMGVDAAFYRRLLLAPWNIVLYNAFGVGGGGQGADLYGVEPPSFYAVNLVLNFNLQAAAAALSPLVLLLELALAVKARRAAGAAKKTDDSSAAADATAAGSPAGSASHASAIQLFDAEASTGGGSWLLPRTRLLALLSQLWLWFALMSSRPHKEERFMFVVFPLVSVAAAVTLVAGADVLTAMLTAVAGSSSSSKSGSAAASGSQQRQPSASRAAVSGGALGRLLTALFLLASALLSGSRIAALARGFSAPFAAWTWLARELQDPAHVPSSSSLSVTAHSVVHARGWESAWEALFLDTSPALAAAAGRPAAVDAVLPRKQDAAGSEAAAAAALPYGSSAPADAIPGALVCVGKEWYRYPSAFFLPERARAGASRATAQAHVSSGTSSSSSSSSDSPSAARPPPGRSLHGPVRLAFLKSDFGGQLPQPFLSMPPTHARNATSTAALSSDAGAAGDRAAAGDSESAEGGDASGRVPGTAVVRGGYNDLNAEEADRYVPLHQCDWVVDALLPDRRSSQSGARFEPYFEGLVSRSGKRRGVAAGLAPILPSGGSSSGSASGKMISAAADAAAAAAAEAEAAAGGRCNCMRLPVLHSDGSSSDAETELVEWRSAFALPFVHAPGSPLLGRAFYVPRVSDRLAAYAVYHVLQKVPCTCQMDSA